MPITRRDFLIFAGFGSVCAAAALAGVRDGRRRREYLEEKYTDPHTLKNPNLPVCRRCAGEYLYTETDDSRSYGEVVSELYGRVGIKGDIITRLILRVSFADMNNLPRIPSEFKQGEQYLFPCMPIEN